VALPSCARFPGRAIPKCGESVVFAAAAVDLGSHASLALFGIAPAAAFTSSLLAVSYELMTVCFTDVQEEPRQIDF